MTFCPSNFSPVVHVMPAFLSFLSHDLGGWGIAALGNLVDYVNSPEKGNALQRYHSFLPCTKGFF